MDSDFSESILQYKKLNPEAFPVPKNTFWIWNSPRPQRYRKLKNDVFSCAFSGPLRTPYNPPPIVPASVPFLPHQQLAGSMKHRYCTITTISKTTRRPAWSSFHNRKNTFYNLSHFRNILPFNVPILSSNLIHCFPCIRRTLHLTDDTKLYYLL